MDSHRPLSHVQAMLAEINRADWTGGYAASLAHFEHLQQEKDTDNISSILEIGKFSCTCTCQFRAFPVSPSNFL